MLLHRGLLLYAVFLKSKVHSRLQEIRRNPLINTLKQQQQLSERCEDRKINDQRQRGEIFLFVSYSVLVMLCLFMPDSVLLYMDV